MNSRKKVGWILVVLLAFCGCANLKIIHQDPMAEVKAAWLAYDKVVASLAEARERGVFTPEVSAEISRGLDRCEDFLKDWQKNVVLGQERPDAWDDFQRLLSQVKLYLYMNGKEA